MKFLLGLSLLTIITITSYFALSPKSNSYNQTIAQLITSAHYDFRAIESKQLKNEPAVKRQNTTLIFKLKNNKTITLKDNLTPGYSSLERFHFILYLKQFHRFLVFCGFYEGHEWLLIHDTTGEITTLDDSPLFSPDNKRFLTAGFCEHGACESGVTIYRITDSKLIEEWTHEDNAEEAKWLSRNEIQYTRTSYEPFQRKKIVVKKSRGKWVES